MSDRETKFLKWAELTWQRLDRDYFDSNGIRSAEDTHKILAECAYDLLDHCLHNVDGRLYYVMHVERQGRVHDTIKRLPDMTEWPENGKLDKDNDHG